MFADRGMILEWLHSKQRPSAYESDVEQEQSVLTRGTLQDLNNLIWTSRERSSNIRNQPIIFTFDALSHSTILKNHFHRNSASQSLGERDRDRRWRTARVSYIRAHWPPPPLDHHLPPHPSATFHSPNPSR